MADITLTALAPGSPVQGVPSGNAPLSATGGGLPSVLATLPPGTLIQGFVLNRDAQGQPILRTDSGDFLIHSDFFLKIGSDVVVRLNGTGSSARASIVSVDGHTPQEAQNIPAHNEEALIVRTGDTPAQPRGNVPQQATTAATTPLLPAVLRQSANITGTLVRPSPDAPQLPSNTGPALQPGTRVLFQLVSVAPPPQQPQAQTQPLAEAVAPRFTLPTANAPEAAPTFTAPPAAAQPPAAAPTPQYGAYARYAAQQTPGSPASPPSASQASTPLTVQAEVIATPTGSTPLTVVQTPLGTVHLDNSLPMPAGSRLTLQVLQTAAPAPELDAAPLQSASPSTIVSLSNNWQSLNQIVDTLTQIDPNTAARFLRGAMPVVAYGANPMPQNLYPSAQSLGTGMMFFMSALSGGDFRGWIGDHAAQLLDDHGHGALLAKAEGEFNVMRSLYADAPPQQWQALFLPIMAEGDTKMLRFYTKRDRKPPERGRPQQSDTRFIVEMELSQTGPLQLDGLVRKRDRKTQFDLMIRSREPFTEQQQRDIISIYGSIGDATGYSGSVLFQQTSVFTVRPLEEILSSRHREVTA